MSAAGLDSILAAVPVVPVITLADWRTGVPLARALVKGGLSVIEITLRAEGALEAIRAIAGEVEGAQVGAGTVLTPKQYADAAAAQARFVVSPGASAGLVQASEDHDVPFLPGSATATEALTLLDYGYSIQKFFPAEPAGGVGYLSAMAAPIPGVRFCPTGGIGLKNAPAYLALPNVICVGGSWLAPKEVVAAGDWARIEALAREAAAIRKRK